MPERSDSAQSERPPGPPDPPTGDMWGLAGPQAAPAPSALQIDELQPGVACGEGCDRDAAVRIDGIYTYCWPCVYRLVRLGTVFEAAMSEARDVD